MPWSSVLLIGLCALGGAIAAWFTPVWIARLPEPDLADDETKPPYTELASWPALRPVAMACSAVLCGLFAWRLGPHPALPALLYVGFVGVVLTYIDLRVRLLPNAIVLPSYPILLGLLLIGAIVSGEWARFGWTVLWGAAVWTLFAVAVLIYPPGMGFGDVKLVGLLGFGVGWFGAGQVLLGVLAGFVLGGVVSVGLLIARRANRKSPIPFGPFLVAGFVLAALAGPDLLPWYVDQIG